MTTASKHHTRGEGDMRHRIAAFLLLTVALLGGLGWTAESWAQAELPRVGYLLTFVKGTNDALVGQNEETLTRTLAAHGWIEGKNVLIERRTARGEPPRFDEPAAELVRSNVDIICAESAPAVRAAYAATRTIPIVALDFTNDPVAAGYVESYGRPGVRGEAPGGRGAQARRH